MERRNILLTFNGDQDPFNRDGKEGPILTLLNHKKGIKAAYIFYTPVNKEKARMTEEKVKEKYSIEVKLFAVNVDDPIDYRPLLSELRRHIPALLRESPLPDYLILLSPGTPQMHASWFMLAASREIPDAKLCQTRPPHYIDPEKNWGPILDIDHEESWFPLIQSASKIPAAQPLLLSEDVEKAIREAGIIGSPETIKLIARYSQAARLGSVILINGESGTGKEHFARFIHNISLRNVFKFVPFNCAAIPENLIESELFGFDKGGFTGAARAKKGLFEEAHEGTLFLDEIGDMSPSMQVKVLRAINNGEITHLGSTCPIEVDVRIIAATNKDLPDLVKKGLFREDLFYRLNVVPVTLPPLRERRDDIPLLAHHFKDMFNKNFNMKKKLTKEAMSKLIRHEWRGNIRELKNVMERAFVRSMNSTIEVNDIVFDELGYEVADISKLPAFTAGFSLETHIAHYRDALFKKALKQANGQQSEAARLLGVTPAAISKWKRKDSPYEQNGA